jgi:phosphoribosylglycinamide formyltransferase-1
VKRIVIFASGSGSNAQRIIEYFREHPTNAEVVAVYTNNPNAYVIERCKALHVTCRLFNRTDFYNSTTVLDMLQHDQAHLLVLAGFLWLIPPPLVHAYPQRILNIHPALLPAYGGKGMYGHHVHEAVMANKEKESGITIHLVNEEYDKGAHLFQAKVNVTESDTPDSLAQKIHELEHKHFPEVIDSYLQKLTFESTK